MVDLVKVCVRGFSDGFSLEKSYFSNLETEETETGRMAEFRRVYSHSYKLGIEEIDNLLQGDQGLSQSLRQEAYNIGLEDGAHNHEPHEFPHRFVSGNLENSASRQQEWEDEYLQGYRDGQKFRCQFSSKQKERRRFPLRQL